jgi:dipeptidyl aminopeptidase/acylaminoacyl peptidase
MYTLLCGLLWMLAPPAPSAFTVEQVMSAPFPTELTAAPHGGAVAWVQNNAGARNVWVAGGPAYTPRQLTAYTGDDGEEITDVHWRDDGRGLVYVRGGDLNSHGEYPNPTLVPEGTEQAIWAVGLTGGAPKKLGVGSGPAVAGDSVAFVYKDQIWQKSPGFPAAQQLLHTRGKARWLRWSPDRTKLAFVSGRGDHAFIGVYDSRSHALRYLVPGLDDDEAPVWSPDSKRVAFLRLPAVTRTAVFSARRTGRPWSIWVADVETGVGQAIWTASAGAGSVFRELDSNDMLLWSTAKVLVFPWERDGWTHLYGIDPGDHGDHGHAANSEPRLLTPGKFEVEQAALAAGGKAVLLTSNQNDSERRHLWRVDLPSGSPVAVTTGDGIEWSPVATEDGADVANVANAADAANAANVVTIALLRSGARTPARVAITTSSGSGREVRDLTAIPKSFPAEAALVTPEPVTFAAADGLPLDGQLFLPSDLKPGERRPAIVFFHGGSRRQMLLGFHYMEFYHNAYAMNQYLASRGYIVLSVNYRSGIGYGLDFREALDFGASGASEFNDVQGAGLYLRSRADVDPARIGVWGGSYGGYLTSLALARASGLFAAGVDYAGVHDWNLEFDALVPGWDVERDQRARQIAFRSSALADVDRWRSPVLLAAGDDDRNVTFSQTVELAEDLRARGVHVETVVFPDETHDLQLHRSWIALLKAADEFLARQLRATANAAP